MDINQFRRAAGITEQLARALVPTYQHSHERVWHY